MRLKVSVLLLSLILILPVHTCADSDDRPLESQIYSFMSGLKVKNPKQVSRLWILGVNNRSGAVQFAALSPSLQKETKKTFEQLNWVTGQSSPWVTHFSFVKENKISKTKVQYTVAYDLTASYGDFGTHNKIITVEKDPKPSNPFWYISKITTKKNPYEAFTPAETVVK